MGRSVRLGVVACATVLLTVTGCGESGPTAAQAGETLKTHITELMKKGHVLDIQITDPGGRDVPCGNGKAKRTFAAAGRDSAPEREPKSLNIFMLGTIDSVAPYRIVEDRGNGPVRLANKETRTVIVLESPANGRYAVRGETECLPLS